VSPASIRAAARVPMGRPLLTTDIGMIERRVETVIPAVKSVDVSREWPNKILIKVTERTPVAVIDEADGLHALDATGQVFLDYKTPPPGLPVVESTSSDTDALAQGAQVAAALPSSLARKVDHVQVYTADHIALALGDGRTIMWGSAADSDLKAQVLAALMSAQSGAHHYDVSVPGSPVAE
jgi:cell division protein FtsQ